MNPKSTEDVRTAARRIGNEIVDFVERRCELSPTATADKDALWRAFVADYREQRSGMEYRGARNSFYEALKSAYSELNTEYREDIAGTRTRGPRRVRGLRLVLADHELEQLARTQFGDLSEDEQQALRDNLC